MARSLVKIQNAKNYFINGAMDFAQRIGSGGSHTISGAAGYYADRWLSYYTNNGTAASVSNEDSISTPDPKIDRSLRYTYNADTLNSGLGLAQRVESINAYELNGSPISISLSVNSTSATSVRLRAYVNVIKDNISGAVVEYDVTKTFAVGSWQEVKFENILLSSNIANGAQFQFDFSDFTVTGSSQTLAITKVMLNKGQGCSSFARFADDVAGELRACERYYEKSFPLDLQPQGTGSTYMFVKMQFLSGNNASFSTALPFKTRKKDSSITMDFWNNNNQTHPQVAGIDSTGSTTYFTANPFLVNADSFSFSCSSANFVLAALNWTADSEL